MNIIEAEFVSKERPPACCYYCDQEKDFLMVKPVAWSYKGEMVVNVNYTSKKLWTCVECLSLSLDFEEMGIRIEIHEYEE